MEIPLIFKIQIYFWLTFLISLIPLFLVYRFWFFLRDPERKIPAGNNIVSPADGMIVYIREIKNNKEIPFSIKNNKKIYLNELMDDAETNYNLVIGIFMTPFSVHYNRIPFEGRVIKNYYRSTRENKTMLGVFLNLVLNLKPYTKGAEYILENERNTLVIKNDYVQGAVVQIASTWIDNIKNKEIKIGDVIKKGEKFGMIRMGSHCDLFIKTNKKYRLSVKERKYVKAGKSILIEIDE